MAEKTFGSVRRKSKKGNKHKNIGAATERDVFGAVSFFALTTNQKGLGIEKSCRLVRQPLQTEDKVVFMSHGKTRLFFFSDLALKMK